MSGDFYASETQDVGVTKSLIHNQGKRPSELITRSIKVKFLDLLSNSLH